MVPDVAPQTQQAWDLAAGSSGTGGNQFNAATAGYLNSLGQTPSSVTAGKLATTDLSPYMNPYTQDVIDKTIPIMQQQLGQQYSANAGSAANQNAFGGSRYGVQQGVAQAQGAQNIGQMLAQLNQQNFTQAQAGATGDINRDLAAQTSNQQANQAKINSDILASQGLGNLGTAATDANLKNYGLLSSAGASQSAQAQNEIGANMAKFNEARTYPNTQLGILEGALNMTPHDIMQTGTSEQSTTTPTDWMGVAKDAFGAAANVGKIAQLSDKRMKKDITSMGADPITGVPVKSFRYKGDPSSSPKIIGPLAQDVEKSMPGATVSKGGVMGVPRGALAAATPSVAAQPNFAAKVGKPLDSFMPKSRTSAIAMPRAGARGLIGALANTKRRAGMGALGG
jgi:hypothetical protein